MATKLETFLASVSSRSTADLFALWLIHDRPYGSSELYALVASDTGTVDQLRIAAAAIRSEIDRRIPRSQDQRDRRARDRGVPE